MKMARIIKVALLVISLVEYAITTDFDEEDISKTTGILFSFNNFNRWFTYYMLFNSEITKCEIDLLVSFSR